jgi:methylmalonyl-CoA mutase N-terminal domain/subunit
MKNKFHVTDQKALTLRFHTQTGGSTLTAQQPQNNAIRVSFQAMAAVLGGTQSLHTNGMDEALALPTEASAQLALRTQQIIANETGVTDVIDPLGGSYYIENLTNKIEEKVNTILETIEKIYGGMVNAIENGYPQREIHNSAFIYQQEIEKKKKIIVGVNKYQNENENVIPLLKVDEAIEKDQINRLSEFKKSRDKKLVLESLETLKLSAEKPDVNVVPYILDCVRKLCTVGEISNILRSVWGEYKAPDIF